MTRTERKAWLDTLKAGDLIVLLNDSGKVIQFAEVKYRNPWNKEIHLGHPPEDASNRDTFRYQLTKTGLIKKDAYCSADGYAAPATLELRLERAEKALAGLLQAQVLWASGTEDFGFDHLRGQKLLTVVRALQSAQVIKSDSKLDAHVEALLQDIQGLLI